MHTRQLGKALFPDNITLISGWQCFCNGSIQQSLMAVNLQTVIFVTSARPHPNTPATCFSSRPTVVQVTGLRRLPAVSSPVLEKVRLVPADNLGTLRGSHFPLPGQKNHHVKLYVDCLMQRCLHFISIAVVAVVAVCLLYVQPFPVLHDYPEWMYQGWLAHQLLFGDVSAAGTYTLAQYPVPNSMTQFGIAVLNNFLSPVMAGKAWLAFYLLFAATLWTLLSRVLHRGYDGSIHLILTMTITLGPGFWNGYANFQFALLLWGAYLLLMRLHRSGVVMHLFLSLLIFFSHASVFIAFAGFVMARVLFGRLDWRCFVAIVPAIVLFLWYLLSTVSIDAIGQVNALGLLEWVQYKVYTVAKQGYFHNFILADGSSLLDRLNIVYLAGVVLNLGVAVVIFFWLLQQGMRLFTRLIPFRPAIVNTGGADKDPFYLSVETSRVLMVSLLALLLLFLIGGKDNFGVVNLGERFFIAALVLALVNLGCSGIIRRVWVALAAVGALYTMAATVAITGYPVEPYSVSSSTTSGTLDGAVDDIFANSRHKLFNHRLYIYADHGLWLLQPGPDLLAFKHVTSFVVESGRR
jgi:hypothetical protein